MRRSCVSGCAWRVSARASPAAPLPPPGWAMRVASLSTRIACCAAPAPWMGDARGESQHAHRLLRRSRPLDGRCAWRVSARASPAAPLPPPGWAMRVASLSTRIACCAAPAPWMGDARGESQHAHRLLRRSRPLDGRCAWRVSARASPAAPLPPPGWAMRVASLSTRIACCAAPAPWMGDARGESQHAHRLLRRSRPLDGRCAWRVSARASPAAPLPPPGWAMRLRVSARASPAAPLPPLS